ncbi:MAG: hypothetical protein JJE21_05915 [Spirochaetaceae bacterium]|nr:hypothetical protein [Spirochaetaceae bacterium]
MAEDKNKHYSYRERKILVIDLTTDEYSVIPLEEKFCKKFIGGKSLAYQLWDRYAIYNKLEKEDYYSGNPIVFSLGAASDLSLDYCSSSTIVSLSYETGTLVNYNFISKSFVSSMASLNVSALVIKGRARRLTAIKITLNHILIEVNESYHLLSTSLIEQTLEYDNSIISIGPIGELLSDYASIVIDGNNVGRGGIGSMFGLKNLKVISFNVDKNFRKPYFSEKYEKVTTFFLPKVLSSVNLLNEANKYGWAAIEGFKYRYDPRLWGLGGTDLTPTCELDWLIALALGANLGFYDAEKVEVLNQCCLELGFDPFSISVLLIWLENAIKNKIVLYNMVPNNSRLENFLLFLEAIAKGKSHMSNFSMGVDKLNKYLGGPDDFNFTAHGKELLPLDLRGLPGFTLATLIDDDTLVPWELFGKQKKGYEAEGLYTAQIIREIAEDLGIDYISTLKMFALEGGYTRKKNKKIISILSDFLAISEGYILEDNEELLNKFKNAFFENKKIIDKVNSITSSISDIPIHFINDLSSNYKKAEVVVIGSSLEDYKKLLEEELNKLSILKSK